MHSPQKQTEPAVADKETAQDCFEEADGLIPIAEKETATTEDSFERTNRKIPTVNNTCYSLHTGE